MHNMDLLEIKIKDLMKNKNNVVIAIDGRAGSGKTTLANLLKQKFNAQIIHMDDFFLPLDLRTEKRYAEIGGNIHYERFYSEVSNNIKRQDDFSYRVFSCKECDYVGIQDIKNIGLIIVEGVYSMHPKLIMDYDLTIFLDIDDKEQKKRIINRNGAQMYENFKNIWIPMENAYFDKFSIREKSDIKISRV